jgi:Rha family phage regulatory protein
VNSRDVAKVFEKRHGDVLDSIDNLLKSLATENSVADFGFILCPYTDETQPGREFRSFDLTRDAFTLLAMGFTGEKALGFKVAYIQRGRTRPREAGILIIIIKMLSPARVRERQRHPHDRLPVVQFSADTADG